MSLFHVDAARCRKDGICSSICPIGIISVADDGLPYMLEGQQSRCIGCGHCVAFCPHGASSLEHLPMERVVKVERSLLPGAEAVDLLLKSRRSLRFFNNKAVPRELVQEIIETASYQPTAKNQRAVRWVVINGRENLDKINALIAGFFDRYAVMEPPTPQKRAGKILANMWRKGQDPFLRGARQLAVAIAQKDDWGYSDCAVGLTYFELAAHARGVGCCWAGYFTSACPHTPELLEFLGVKSDEMVGGGHMFGYPKVRVSYIPPRAVLPVNWIE